MSTIYSAGRDREYRVIHAMAAHGWTLVSRSAGSKGPVDLVMAHPDVGLALVQVGSKSKRLGPGDRARLLHLANMCAALPLVVNIEARRPWIWSRVENGRVHPIRDDLHLPTAAVTS